MGTNFHVARRSGRCKAVCEQVDPGADVSVQECLGELPVIKQARCGEAFGIVSPWSNGQTEGQITRLKLIKRQMYGRAKLDLLQARLIGAK